MIDSVTIPDDLAPRTIASQQGRAEDYWTTRNALVDAVKAAIKAPVDTSLSLYDRHAPYREAMAALEAFDRANGGTPVL